jgi:prepilin peptidase CpaA
VDVSSRRIPNELTFGLAGVGLLLSVFGFSGVSVGASLLGGIVGLLMMLPGHVLGATGAGDVKLFAAAGTVLGVGRILEAFFLVVITGAVFALVVAWQRGRLLQTVQATGRLLGKPRETKATLESPTQHNRFPYGPAIAVGCVLAVLA